MNRQTRAVAGSLAAVAVATGLVYALKPIAPVLSLGVVYVLAVLVCAVCFGASYGVAVALASMVTFNYLFLPPVHTLTLADARNWAALGVYLTTAVVASQLAASARRRAAEARQREREAALLADAAAAVLREEPLSEIGARAAAVLEGAGAHARARFDAGLASLLALADERRGAEEVRRSDAVKTVILQTVSHDFRTPIATIQAAVGGLEDTQLDLHASDRSALLETISVEAARLARLVENVLDLSRLQAGVAAPRLELWDVDGLLACAVAELSDRMRVRIAAADGLPVISVDSVQVQRVLVNLLDNALKFSSDEVSLQARADGAHVVIEVLDRGRGIDAAPTSRRGLGLGLAIAHGFAEANGGTLWVGVREGGGTSARLVFPAQSVPATLA
jgi:two-component system sensor histidine kinase KdpD